jgi:CHASE2 domain-containing sensor protein
MTPQTIAKELRQKSAWYWARVVCVAGAGLFLNAWLASHPPQWMLELRLAAYQILSKSGPRTAQIGHLAIVEISDEEYWKGTLAGRRPIKRDYLASVVKALCNGGAQVVALDFDLRSPVQDGSLANHPDYRLETDELAREIRDAAGRCRLVLPRTLHCPNPPDGKCTKEESVLDSYSFDPKRVTWGYINLPTDVRQIPLRRDNVEAATIDSFSQAVAAADSPDAFGHLKAIREFPFGSFISEDQFRASKAVLRAQDVLKDDSQNLAAVVGGKTVLVGASWHSNAFGRGSIVDSHVSPVGSVPGVFIHANYAAALLDGRAYVPVGEVFTSLVDVIIVGFVAVFFAVPMVLWQRWCWLVALAAGLALVSYICWQNFGLFVEATIPAVLLLAHSLFDSYVKMREELSELRAKLGGRPTHAAIGE